MKQFDVVVVGGGHAGVEAAHAAARMGAEVALVTFDRSAIGVMSCNPAIGGLGKGHLVREIDALDGLMARVGDQAGIQYRLLNRRKGPAVQGPRAQQDRVLYRRAMQTVIWKTKGIHVLEGEVVDLIVDGGNVTGVVLSGGESIRAKATVLTTGTFLRGIIHVGDRKIPGGRFGERASNRLSDRIESFGLALGRLKTGTPPRLARRSIDWSSLAQQPGDDEPVMLSFVSSTPVVGQVSCAITHTNERTHEIIRENLTRSAIYGGSIESVGPRYCPSIEDKVVRFAEKQEHQIFLEPEGLEGDLVYPNGISTSLPEEVQEEFVRSVRGLESAEIMQYGYAIEYDFVDPRCLTNGLEVKSVGNLYLAGQINGTTGYEEAAAQGLVAGLNAAVRVRGGESIYFSRADAYIGVMIDDLVTRGVSEPYRMFTSRAEYRLKLRADNADQRLTPLGVQLGCVGESRKRMYEDKAMRLDVARTRLRAESFSPTQIGQVGITIGQDGVRRNGIELLSFPNVDFDDLAKLAPHLGKVEREIREQITREAVYENYIARHEADIEHLKRDERIGIPAELNYRSCGGLSNELREKLEAARPNSLAQAARIEGMTPAALMLLLTEIRRLERRRAAG